MLCQCTCPTQFPMVRVGDNGKYKVGDKLIIFLRILRRHIMVRVGGGWQELSEFLRAKDPCRGAQRCCGDASGGRCSQQSMAATSTATSTTTSSPPHSMAGSQHNGSQGSLSARLGSPLSSMASSSCCLETTLVAPTPSLASMPSTHTTKATVTMIPTRHGQTPAPVTPSQSLLRLASSKSRLALTGPNHRTTKIASSNQRSTPSYRRNFGSISSSASMSWLANN